MANGSRRGLPGDRGENLQFFIQVGIGPQLIEQALTQVASSDARWIERLDNGQRLFSALDIFGSVIGWKQIAQTGLEVATVAGVQRGDNAFQLTSRHRYRCPIQQLVIEVVIERLGTLEGVGHQVMCVDPGLLACDCSNDESRRTNRACPSPMLASRSKVLGVGLVVLDHQFAFIFCRPIGISLFFVFVGFFGQIGICVQCFEHRILVQFPARCVLAMPSPASARFPSTESSSAASASAVAWSPCRMTKRIFRVLKRHSSGRPLIRFPTERRLVQARSPSNYTIFACTRPQASCTGMKFAGQRSVFGDCFDGPMRQAFTRSTLLAPPRRKAFSSAFQTACLKRAAVECKYRTRTKG